MLKKLKISLNQFFLNYFHSNIKQLIYKLSNVSFFLVSGIIYSHKLIINKDLSLKIYAKIKSRY